MSDHQCFAVGKTAAILTLAAELQLPSINQLLLPELQGLLADWEVLLCGETNRVLVSLDGEIEAVTFAKSTAFGAQRVEVMPDSADFLRQWFAGNGSACECTRTYSCVEHAPIS